MEACRRFNIVVRTSVSPKLTLLVVTPPIAHLGQHGWLWRWFKLISPTEFDDDKMSNGWKAVHRATVWWRRSMASMSPTTCRWCTLCSHDFDFLKTWTHRIIHLVQVQGGNHGSPVVVILAVTFSLVGYPVPGTSNVAYTSEAPEAIKTLQRFGKYFISWTVKCMMQRARRQSLSVKMITSHHAQVTYGFPCWRH